VLKSDANQHHIRALLLAGLRSALLWNQVGGKRRHFIFSRKQMLKAAQQLLQIA
jgi:high frequency lysogenization protein